MPSFADVYRNQSRPPREARDQPASFGADLTLQSCHNRSIATRESRMCHASLHRTGALHAFQTSLDEVVGHRYNLHHSPRQVLSISAICLSIAWVRRDVERRRGDRSFDGSQGLLKLLFRSSENACQGNRAHSDGSSWQHDFWRRWSRLVALNCVKTYVFLGHQCILGGQRKVIGERIPATDQAPRSPQSHSES